MEDEKAEADRIVATGAVSTGWVVFALLTLGIWVGMVAGLTIGIMERL